MNPNRAMIGLRRKPLLFGARGHRDDAGDGPSLGKLFDPAPDRRQRGFIADQQPPVEVVRHDRGTPGAADLRGISWLGVARPLRHRPRVVQGEIDKELIGQGVKPPRRVVAAHGFARFARHDDFDVVVGRSAGESRERVAGQRQPQHLRRHMLGAPHDERAAMQFVPDAGDLVLHSELLAEAPRADAAAFPLASSSFALHRARAATGGTRCQTPPFVRACAPSCGSHWPPSTSASARFICSPPINSCRSCRYGFRIRARSCWRPAFAKSPARSALLTRRLRRLAGLMLALYAICVFPANLRHAIEAIDVPPLPSSWWYHGPRLLFQPVFVWWALFAGELIDWPWRRND